MTAAEGTVPGLAPLGAVAEAMSSSQPGALDEALARLESDDWRRLAKFIGTSGAQSVQRDRSRAVSDKLGTVVLLPGIMGTDLAVLGDGDIPSTIWFNLKALVAGHLAKLSLPVDGSAPAFQVQPGGLMKLFYLPIQVRLGIRWRAQLFPYDWRLDIGETADELAETLRPFLGQPTNFVAHSMGGLVVRAMIVRHPDVWEALRLPGQSGPQGGRLIMLGTPNQGSFAPALAFTGSDRKLRTLALIAPTLSRREVSAVVATFPGLYEMLPFHGTSGGADELSRVEGWPVQGVHQQLLSRAAEFQKSVKDVVDSGRMVYVAGYGHPTVDGFTGERGRSRWHLTDSGDGVVPHSLGRLSSVPTFWSPAKHGRLPKDPGVLRAIDDLLLDGTTKQLPSGDTPPGRREVLDQWVDDADLVTAVEASALQRQTQDNELALLADVVPVSDGIAGDTRKEVPQVSLRIEVVWGDIGTARGDVLAVGHYEDVYPTAAEAALDVALSGDIPREERVLHGSAARRSLRGELGQVNLFPFLHRNDGRIAAVVGLGRPGTFGLSGAEVLVRNLLWTASHVAGARSLSMVLIGSGAGNLSIGDALDGLVRALDAAASAGELAGGLREVQIVEYEFGRARSIAEGLMEIASRRQGDEPVSIELAPLATGEGGVVSKKTALEELLAAAVCDRTGFVEKMVGFAEDAIRGEAIRGSLREIRPQDLGEFEVRRRADLAPSEAPTRLSIIAREGDLVVTAISDSATVPERKLGLEIDLFRALVEQANAEAAGNVARAGGLLMRLAVPQDFRSFLEHGRAIILEVDPFSAGLPWEILNPRPFEADGFPALRTPLARQLRTTLSPPPIVSGRVSLRRALVIGDPGIPGGTGRLPGARKEAASVGAQLRRYGVEVDVLCGPDRATLATVLHHLLTYEYDMVHYAGHGAFSTGDSSEGSGWFFPDGLLKGRHLTMVERLPPLVVANACHSGRMSTNLPGLADEFIGRGVRNLVGTARAVSDAGAPVFSRAFYDTLLFPAGPGQKLSSLGQAVLKGRKELWTSANADWDAYQLYGDPDFRFWEVQ